MKDNSKAQWPDGMTVELLGNMTATISETGSEIFIGRVCGDNIPEAQARARQICALPRMVALLKAISDSRISRGAIYDFSHQAQAILRDIGEIE